MTDAITFSSLLAFPTDIYSHAPLVMVQKTIASTVFWLFCFLVFRAFVQRTSLAKHLEPKEYNTWGMKVCCVVHSSFQGVVGAWLLLTDPVLAPELKNFFQGKPYNFITSVSPNVALFFPITLGFFVYELVCLPLWWSPKEAPMVFHHVIPLLLLSTPCFDIYSCFFMFTELSSPFIQFRWFIEKHLSRGHPLYAINGIVMVLAFLCTRIIPIPHLHKSLFGSLHIVNKLSIVEQAYAHLYHIPSLVNIYWSKLMLEGLLKHVFAKKVPQDKKTGPKKD
eukprot:c22949_g1_i1.p1 GENE.c22949_g1_i1~~c22949_g1_i1.p1  ORF type:complete len:279 (-),score=32.47 c22949_g1_i1:26-862(-)